MENKDIKEIISLFDFSKGKYNREKIFSEVLILEINFINAFMLGKEKSLKDFNKIIKNYTLEEQKQIIVILLQLAQLYDKYYGQYEDILGNIFNQLNIENKNISQFFTPTHISNLITKIVEIDENKISKKGFLTLYEPACGSGGMILSYAKTLKEKGYNPSNVLYVEAWDIDILCTYMTFLQLAMYDIPAKVVNGNTLTLKENFVLYTPQYFLGGWNFKERKLYDIE